MAAHVGLCLVTLCGLTFGSEPTGETADVVKNVDVRIEAKWASHRIHGAALADDAVFLRRIWLDLAGHVPSALTVRRFMDDARTDKRERMIDELLSGDDFAENWARTWAVRITDKRPIRHAIHDGRVLQAYLSDGLKASKSYKQIAEEIITGDGARDTSGPANFLLRYEAKAEPLAAAIGKHFLGATLQCAQCHDHVFAQWKQDEFRGLAAFFSRLKMMVSEDGTLHAVVESRRGEFQFMDVAAKPAADGSIPMTTVMPRLPIAGAVPLPASARRRQLLAAWITSPENPWFARHAVNTNWEQLFGIPLVGTLDDPHAAVESTNGDILELLARDFIGSGYDLKRLIRIIVSSDAYQRAGAGDRAAAASISPDEPPVLDGLHAFAEFPARPLTVDQLYFSINQATGIRSNEEAFVDNPLVESADDDATATSDRPVESLGERDLSVQRSLVLLNSPFAHEAVQSGARIATTMCGRRIGRSHVEWLFLATLSRLPDDREMTETLDLVRGDQGVRGLEDALWVLLNSAEFNTNH